MKTNKKLLAISATLIMAVSTGVVKAEDAESTQIRTQDQLRIDANVQASDNVSAQTQTRLRDQKMEQLNREKMQQKKVQVRNEYQNRMQIRQSGSVSASGSMMRQNMMIQNRTAH